MEFALEMLPAGIKPERSQAAAAENAIAAGLLSMREPLEIVLREHSGRFYRLAYAVVRRADLAEDAVQEAALRALRYRRRLALVRDPAAWLARIVYRAALVRRPPAAELPLETVAGLAGLAASGTPADELAAQAELRALLRQLMDSLPARLRLPLLLSLDDELSPAEIGRLLGLREPAVRQRLAAARKLLARKLAARLEVRHGR